MGGALPIWRLLRDGPAEGAWNMAVDEALIVCARRPVLRLYTWDRPTVSLGYRQPAPPLPPGESVGLVRRVTGGGAVLHAGDLTYSVAAPHGTPGLPDSLRQSYAFLRDVLLRGLRRAGIAAESACGAPGAERSELCFAGATGLEIDVDRAKLVGSAQRRLGWGFLQHGSLRVADDGALYERLFGARLAAPSLRPGLGPDAVAAALEKAFAEALDGRLEPSALTQEEHALAQEFANLRCRAPLSVPELSSRRLSVCADRLP